MKASGHAAELVGPALGDAHPAGVRRDDGEVAVAPALASTCSTSRSQGEQVVDRAVEEALDLRGVQVDGHEPVGAGGLEQVGDQAGGDRLAAAVLLVLPGVGENGATTVIRLAEARLSASTMISCSMSQVLIGAVWLCTTKASQPRTDSSKRTKISPLANS